MKNKLDIPKGFRLATEKYLEEGRIKPGIKYWCNGFKKPIKIDSQKDRERFNDFEDYKRVLKKYISQGILYIKN